MPDGAHKGSFVQAYNAQAAVDSTAQIIVAAEITQQTNDKQQLVPMLQQVIDNVNGKPQVASADTGYWSAANVTEEACKASTCMSPRTDSSTARARTFLWMDCRKEVRSYSRCETS